MPKKPPHRSFRKNGEAFKNPAAWEEHANRIRQQEEQAEYQEKIDSGLYIGDAILGQINEWKNTGHFKEAIAVGESRLLDYDEPNLRSTVAICYIRTKNYAPAIKHLQKAQEQDPSNPKYASMLGNAYLKDNQVPEAQACFERVLRMYPDDFHAMANLASCASAKGDVGQANEWMKKVFTYDEAKKDRFLLSQMAELLRGQGKMQEALNYLEQARACPGGEKDRRLLWEKRSFDQEQKGLGRG